MRVFPILKLLVVTLTAGGVALAQNLLPPLSAWQAGEPIGALAEGNVQRTTVGGQTVLVVRGAGEDSVYWRTPTLSLQPGRAYVFRFRTRAEGTGGTIISGLNTVNHDFGAGSQWREFAFAFRAPEMSYPFARLGQWYLKGQVFFDHVELYPAQVVHRRWGNLMLGEGESLQNGEYIDRHMLGWYGTTIHRTLWRQQAYFNTNRWVLTPGNEVIYRHHLPFPMREATLSLHVNHHTGGAVIAEVSHDGEQWQRLIVATKVGQVEADLPASLFPTQQVYVRLSAEGEGMHGQIDTYQFRAKVDYRSAPRVGQTLIVEERDTSPSLQVQWSADGNRWLVQWQNQQPASRQLEVAIGVDGRWRAIGKVELRPRGSAQTQMKLTGLSSGKHTIALRATSGRASVYFAQTEVTVMVLDESHYGYPLPAPEGFGEVWWCEGAWKVGRHRPAPTGKASSGILVEAARGEYEPAQLVLRAREPNTILQSVSISDLKGAKTHISASQVKLFEVAAVRVENPSDSLGTPGDYPDPLPPLATPLPLPAEANQAIWILVHVPESAQAGTYTGTIKLRTSCGVLTLPLKVRVFDFTLPAKTHLRSGFGIDAGLIERYHHLQTDEQKRTVWDMYMRSFAEHRIAPYAFYTYNPIHVRFEGEGANKKVIVDFTEFDKAAQRYLDEMGFNAFLLYIQGLGGGTFYERYEGEFGGFKAGTPEYERLFGDYLRQIESHLREKGWLEKAYVYWFDEPEPRDYDFVIEGMQRIKRHAPGIRRLLTEQPEPPLYGHVEIWCGLTPEWTKERVAERRKAGEEVWWYICTGPRAPYIGLFIEHPAVEMRLWSWQSWQYGVQGILIWQTNYWTSPTAFSNSLQNPWEDPMSYVTGYGVPAGTKQFWGNGDGRFLYPPRRDPNKAHSPAVQPPISSIRWENLRDGVEDYEYFVLLQKQIERVSQHAPATLLAEAQKLLEVPEHISKDLTHFTTDPRPLLEHRRKIALMIERLQKIERGKQEYAQEER
ncbi:MAG: glycoside hydrolase domain-containing protein [Armatimonadota bacterium]